MSKEIYISTTPHETRLAIVEDEQLAEIYYERENEYTLAGSIYNGKVTRVLPGMQSSFVDIGLERDAFLYVTDFMEEQGDAADFESESGARRQQQPAREASAEPAQVREGGRDRQDRGDRGRGRRNERPDRKEAEPVAALPITEAESTVSFDEPIAPAPVEATGQADATVEGAGSRRWRGRRGRRRGRGAREDQPVSTGAETTEAPEPIDGFETVEADLEVGFVESMDAADSGAIEIDLESELPVAAAPARQPAREGRQERGRRGRGERERGPRREERPEPAFDNSYAGYMNEEAAPESTGGPILLPGESIRKYRDPAEVAAEDAEAKRNAPVSQTIVIAAPSIEIIGWDGGAVLPGESLGRNRKRNGDRGTGSRETPPVQAVPAVVPTQNEPSPVKEASPALVASEQDFASAAAPEEPSGMTALHTPAASEPVEEAAASTDLEALPGEIADLSASEETTSSTQPEPDQEYEPEEGASASISDTARRDLLRFEQPASPAETESEAQPVQEADQEIAGDAPDQTTYDLSAPEDTESAVPALEEIPVADPIVSFEPAEPEYTSLTAGGEMISITDESADEPASMESLPAQDDAAAAEPTAHEGAVHSTDPIDLEESVPSGASAFFTPTVADSEIHAYGDGDFHEEEIDEDLDSDEYEFVAALANPEDGEVEYEEETLDGTDDAGSVLHEMSQHATHAEEEEDAYASADTGGFTEADFGGEPDDEDEEEAPAEGAQVTPGSESQQQRDGHRRPSTGHGRDRRGGRNSGGSGDRGRGNRRQSMQTSDLPAINELLKPGQEILVQIAKEPIAKKGARITSHIALPGRFLVFMPTVNHTGVSRKISSD
ncbi:MAG: hypothetical protein ACRYGF_18065, partial [Janthinobacterium lividum]